MRFQQMASLDQQIPPATGDTRLQKCSRRNLQCIEKSKSEAFLSNGFRENVKAVLSLNNPK